MNNPLYLYVLNLGEEGKFFVILAITMAWVMFWVYRGINAKGTKFIDERLSGLLNCFVGIMGMFFVMAPLMVWLHDPIEAMKIELVNYPRMVPAYQCHTITNGLGFE